MTTDTELTPEWIAEQLALAEAASPGPWTDVPQEKLANVSKWERAMEAAIADPAGRVLLWWAFRQGNKQPDRDVAFIAAARTGYPLALRRVQELEEALEIEKLSGESIMGARAAIKEATGIERAFFDDCVGAVLAENQRLREALEAWLAAPPNPSDPVGIKLLRTQTRAALRTGTWS